MSCHIVVSNLSISSSFSNPILSLCIFIIFLMINFYVVEECCKMNLAGLNVTACSGTSEQQTLWDQYIFKWLIPCIEVVLFKRFQSHYIDRAGDKIGGFRFVHCGEVFNTVSLYLSS